MNAMKLSWLGKHGVPMVAFLVALAISGCGKRGILEPMTEKLGVRVNDDRPNANSRILSQTIFGDSTRKTTIWDLKSDASGTYGFRGMVDGLHGAGALSASGDRTWFGAANYTPRGQCLLTAASPAPHALLVAGAQDVDGDGQTERGVLSLYSPAGSLLDELAVTSDTSDIVFSSIEPVTDSTFIVTGGERREQVSHPYLALIAVNPNQKLSLRSRVVLDSQPAGQFSATAVFPPPPGDSVLFLCSLSRLSGTWSGVAGIRATLPRLVDATVEWTRQVVVPTGPTVNLTDIVRMGDDVFIVGSGDDSRKQPAPSSGNYWHSALAVSYTRNGDLRWSTMVALTSHMEKFEGVVSTPEAIYAVGAAAAYNRGVGWLQNFGYGLVSKLDPGTGSVMANLSLGLEHYYSSFNDATYAGGVLTCGGFTGCWLGNGPFRGWFCRVDVTSATPYPPAVAIPARESEGTMLRANAPGAAGTPRDGDR